MKYTSVLIMIIFVAACSGNGDNARHAGQNEAHDHGGHVHQEPGAVAGMVPNRQPEHPLEKPAAGLFDSVLDDYMALSKVLVESNAPAAAEAAGQLSASVEQLGQPVFDEQVRALQE